MNNTLCLVNTFLALKANLESKESQTWPMGLGNRK